MKLSSIRIISLGIIILLLVIPSFQSIEKQVVETEYKTRVDSFIGVDGFFKNSFLQKIWGIIEILTGIGLSIFITQLFSLRVLPIILEIGFGPVVFLLVMALILTVPVQLLNGFCLLLEKQFSLGRFQTLLLTVFSFLLYIMGNFLVKAKIPLY
ncbi:MAG TPA: hypothetical protein VKP59_01960 [Candidatus Thermoplasmatota archaeon]|nr:hypothetical protein [Candidatus Thermoplasmatota archaeon]